jgi:predicted dehydrogenase
MKEILMFNYIFSLLLLLVPGCVLAEQFAQPAEHKIVVLGLGGRAQGLLLQCLQCTPHIRVVAVCDDSGSDSLNWFTRNSLPKRATPSAGLAYKKIFEHTYLYPDTEDGIKQLFQDNPQVDAVFVTSSNEKHFRHLNAVLAHSQCKNIYIEKPLFRTLEEFQQFKVEKDDVNIAIGLTLRYANMTRIINDNLQEHHKELGTLKKMKSWERLSLGHGMTIIMMNWRRYISLSGGFLFEKSIHDLDLAFFFMRSLNASPEEIVINTHAAHRLYKKSQKDTLLENVAANDQLQQSIERWSGITFQRLINFVPDAIGGVDVLGTIENVFKDLPDDYNLKTSDIIPDHQRLSATCITAAGNAVEFELEVDMSGMRTQAERGIQFEFERGTVVVDIINSIMTITSQDGAVVTRDLQTNNSFHAGGDTYIAQLILGMLPADRYKATLDDEVVQLATLVGLVSEQQAVGKRKQGARIKKGDDNKWALQ